MTYQSPKGVFDIIPERNFEKVNFQCSELWAFVEKICKELALAYNFKEIRTPIFEHTEVFTRSSGETSDIVSKEMYTFTDKGDRQLTLRPEGTASIARAIVENQLQRKHSVQKLFYLGPFFRYDRPQAGRYRQFHQFGIEVIGIKDPELDAEVISLLMNIIKRLGIKDAKLQLNSIGDTESRESYKKALIDYLTPLSDQLSKESKERLLKNPLRILDSKDKQDRKLLENAPLISEYLNENSKQHLGIVCKNLELLGIPYEINPHLVRGLDYYNQTVFEVVTGNLGAQNTIGAGGRYDGLLAKLGGQDSPSFGFAIGIERVILTLIEQGVFEKTVQGPSLFFIPLDEKSKLKCMELLQEVRLENIQSEIFHKNFKIQKGLQMAFDENASFAVIIGEEELAHNIVKLKDLNKKTEQTIGLNDFSSVAKNLFKQ